MQEYSFQELGKKMTYVSINNSFLEYYNDSANKHLLEYNEFIYNNLGDVKDENIIYFFSYYSPDGKKFLHPLNGKVSDIGYRGYYNLYKDELVNHPCNRFNIMSKEEKDILSSSVYMMVALGLPINYNFYLSALEGKKYVPYKDDSGIYFNRIPLSQKDFVMLVTRLDDFFNNNYNHGVTDPITVFRFLPNKVLLNNNGGFISPDDIKIGDKVFTPGYLSTIIRPAGGILINYGNGNGNPTTIIFKILIPPEMVHKTLYLNPEFIKYYLDNGFYTKDGYKTNENCEKTYMDNMEKFQNIITL